LETIQSGTLLKQAKEQIIQQQQKLIDSVDLERNPDELTRYNEIHDSGSTGSINAEDL